ncbi:MAG TPA: NDP-sugar synthase [Vicinamibacteria bacterium]|jgi:mannose-1-phosphate guanylyltransferase|nr:NDP-sugar synthase [Vicinamibacteria bacterium]
MSRGGLSAVVLAGTHHWSGSSFEKLAPRPLVPVALEPLISYSLRWLCQGGVSPATICANGTSRAIEAAFGGGAELNMELSYYHDGTPRGAAGCVRDAGLRTESETLVIVDGTAIPTVDLAELLASHDESGAAVTAVVHREFFPSAPPSPGGVYVFERRVLDHIPETGFQDIKENLIPKLHRAGERVVAHETGRFCPHVLNAQTYMAVNQWMLQRLAEKGRDHGDESLVHPSAWVEQGALLVGPVQVGARARIQAGATIVGPTSIGAESTVGRSALVARSAVWSGCTVGEGAVVHGCIVGDGAVVPPVARLFNNVVGPEERSEAGPMLASLGRRANRAGSTAAYAGPAVS